MLVFYVKAEFNISRFAFLYGLVGVRTWDTVALNIHHVNDKWGLIGICDLECRFDEYVFLPVYRSEIMPVGFERNLVLSDRRQ